MSPDPARLVAWEVLSELFLDTELSDADIAAMAGRLRETGIGLGALERIYEEEVAPACWRNATALPGGLWSGFDREWLIAEIERRQWRQSFWERVPWLNRLLMKRRTAATRADWLRLRHRLAPPPPIHGR